MDQRSPSPSLGVEDSFNCPGFGSLIAIPSLRTVTSSPRGHGPRRKKGIAGGGIGCRDEGRIGGSAPKLTAHQQSEIRKMVSKGRKTAADAARLFKVHPGHRLAAAGHGLTPKSVQKFYQKACKNSTPDILQSDRHEGVSQRHRQRSETPPSLNFRSPCRTRRSISPAVAMPGCFL